jgi:hypothetical protein
MLLGIALIAASLTLWWKYEERRWHQLVDRFEKYATKFHEPANEGELLVNLMRCNPWHTLWREFEYAPVFRDDNSRIFLGGFHISWPQQSVQLGEESVHVLTSQHPCNSRKLVVHTDSTGRILDVQSVDGIRSCDAMSLSVPTQSPQPVIRLSCTKRYSSNDPLVAYDLTMSKSTANRTDPTTIQIIDRKPEE